MTVDTLGNAIDFGDLTRGARYPAGCSDNTKGVWGGGEPSAQNVMDYVTIATTSNATDFGDLTQGRGNIAACSGD